MKSLGLDSRKEHTIPRQVKCFNSQPIVRAAETYNACIVHLEIALITQYVMISLAMQNMYIYAWNLITSQACISDLHIIDTTCKFGAYILAF